MRTWRLLKRYWAATSQARVVITPGSGTFVAGNSKTFAAVAYDSAGRVVSGASFTWAVVAGAGSINSSGVYSSTTKETARISATYNGLVGYATCAVSAAPADHISLTPSTVSVPESTTYDFVATVEDVYNNDTGLAATLSAVSGTFAGSTYTAPASPGSDTVTASYAGLTDATAAVTVTATIDHITVSAASDAPTVGATDAFTATAYDALNNVLTGITFTWTTSAGSVDSSGVLTVPTVVATITVTATSAGISGNHAVTSVPDAVNSVTVSPSSATVVEGGTQTFTAAVKDQYNNIRTGDTVTWSIAGQNVAYAVAVSPATVSVALNGTQVFTAAVTDKYGNTISSPSVTWSATSGSFTGSTYTAPASGTSDTVTATSGSASGTAAVTLTGGVANLTSPTGTQTGSTTATGNVTTDQGSGTLYWVVSTSATPPSVAQIQLGQDSTGAAAAASNNQPVSATGVQNISATGLTASTTYYAYYQQHDAAGDSTVVASASFTTSSHLYGPDSFTNATTEDLNTYDSRWASWYSDGDILQVVGGANYVRQTPISAGAWCIYALTLTGITADQQITVDLNCPDTSHHMFVMLRAQAAGTNNAYIIEFDVGTAAFVRTVRTGGAAHTFSAATALTANTPTTVVCKITGTTLSVKVGAGSFENWTTSTYASGNPGMGSYSNSAAGDLTNVIVDNI